jgi:3-methyladenine DNA glycosylase AlkD
VEILTLAAPRLGAAKLATVERLLRESGTWALVDGLACNVAGEIALRDPLSWPLIDAWATDADFWVRRSALLALLRGIRTGQPDLPRFTRYAEPMLAEKEFFIRKAIGWVLREISRPDPVWVASWTERHISEMSGVTFREAVRRLPPGEAERLRDLRLPPRVASRAVCRLRNRSDGASFAVETIGRYFIHDPVHHLYDVTGRRHPTA